MQDLAPQDSTEDSVEIDVAAFSGDGRRLLTVEEVGEARVSDWERKELVAILRPGASLAGQEGLSGGRARR